MMMRRSSSSTWMWVSSGALALAAFFGGSTASAGQAKSNTGTTTMSCSVKSPGTGISIEAELRTKKIPAGISSNAMTSTGVLKVTVAGAQPYETISLATNLVPFLRLVPYTVMNVGALGSASIEWDGSFRFDGVRSVSLCQDLDGSNPFACYGPVPSVGWLQCTFE